MDRTVSDRGPVPGQAIRLGLGVTAPLAVVVLAYALWWISDRLLYIGPFDRAVFGWAVVVPAWLMAPVVAGLAWRRLTPRDTVLAPAVLAVVVSAVAAVLFWVAVAHPDCQVGAVRTPAEFVLPSLLVGLVIGAGMAGSGVLAMTIARGGHPWRAALGGAAMEFFLIWVAILVGAAVLGGPGCQRPF